jgi:hypothetical protein
MTPHPGLTSDMMVGGILAPKRNLPLGEKRAARVGRFFLEEWSIDLKSAFGPFETCRQRLGMSAYPGRPEVAAARSIRRE